MIIPLSLIALLAAGAAPSLGAGDAVTVVRELYLQDEQVALIGNALAVANADLCQRRMYDSGIAIGTLGQYAPHYRAAAARVLGLHDQPTVTLIVPKSPAAVAGVRVGDILIDADGAAFAAPAPTAQPNFAPVQAATAVLETAMGDGRMHLTVERGGARLTIDIAGVAACRARFLVAGDRFDAFATPEGWIEVSPKALDFAGTNDAIAAILAHEVAHVALGHGPATGKLRRAQELQADRLMPYLMKRAGVDPGAAVTLWQRFKAKRLGGLFPGGSYPGWSERIRAVSAERDRIAAGSSMPPDELRPGRD